MTTLTDSQRDKLMTDLRNVIHDTEELLKTGASEVGAEAVSMRERVRARLLQAKDSLVRLEESALERAKLAGRTADDYVHENPWPSIGVAAAVGLLIGISIGRR